MAVSQKYGKLMIPHVGDNEPIFILRAQDALAESAIQMYRLLAEAHGCSLGQVIQAEVEAFKRWQGNKRLPD
jgi:hypothetical protein